MFQPKVRGIPFAHDRIHAAAYGIFNAAEKNLGRRAGMLSLVRWSADVKMDTQTILYRFSHQGAHFDVVVPGSLVDRTGLFPRELIQEHAANFTAWLLMQVSDNPTGTS